jgi:hypothetical protein
VATDLQHFIEALDERSQSRDSDIKLSEMTPATVARFCFPAGDKSEQLSTFGEFIGTGVVRSDRS